MYRRNRPEARWRQIVLDILFSLLAAALIWLMASRQTDAFVTWDEPAWVYRSVHFLHALRRGDLAGTLVTGHPGVLTTWSGALSLLWHQHVTGAVTPSALEAIAAVPELQVHDAALMRQLTALLPLARQGIVILHALVGAALYWMVRELLDRRYALVGVLFVALDPFYLGLARVLHLDALAAGLMLLSVLALLAYMRHTTHLHLVLSAIALGLAALTKSYALALAPIAAAILLPAYIGGALGQGTGRQRLGSSRAGIHALFPWARDLLVWALVGLAVYSVLWPAMWVRPMAVVDRVAGMSFAYAAEAGDATAGFFRGAVRPEVGLAFYPVALWFRTTPLALLGVALALVLFALPRRSSIGLAPIWRLSVIWLLVYVILYLGIISIGDKKFDRYALPAILALDVLAALGLVNAGERLVAHLVGGRRGRVRENGWPSLVAVLLIAAQAAWLLPPLYPDRYIAYYNPLAGGLARARATLPVGWGEGVEEMAAYLEAKPDAENLTVATWAVAGLAPTFSGEIVTLSPLDVPRADYVMVYVGDAQVPSTVVGRFHPWSQPEHVVTVRGVPYVWLYRNDYADVLADWIEGMGEGADAVALALPSTLQEHDLGRPVRVLSGFGEGHVAAELESLAAAVPQAAPDLVYVDFSLSPPGQATAGEPAAALREEWAGRQLAQNALLLDEWPFVHGTVRRYRLVDGARFRAVHGYVPRQVRFGNLLRYEGFGLAQGTVQYRQAIGVGISWRALREINEDYHLFVHLRDSAGRRWAQADQPLRDEQGLRTSDWTPETRHRQCLTVDLPAGILPGEYWLAVGVYHLEMTPAGPHTKALPLFDAGGQPAGGEVLIGPVTVEPAEMPPAPEDLAPPEAGDVTFGEVARLFGYGLVPEPPLVAGQSVDLSLYWEILADSQRAYDLVVEWAREDAVAATQTLAPTGAGYAANRWRAGQVLRAPLSLDAPGDLGAGEYTLRLALRDPARGETLAGDAPLATVAVNQLEALTEPPATRHPQTARLAAPDGPGVITFHGYHLDETSIAPGEAVDLTVYWEAEEAPAQSYTVFVHLLDEAGQVRGQVDRIPVQGQRPTDGWVAGDVLVDPYRVPLAADAPAGTYRIQVGLYDAATGERLHVHGADGVADPQRRILLDTPITVGG